MNKPFKERKETSHCSLSLLCFLHKNTHNSSHTSVLPHDLQETSQELQVPSDNLTTRLKAANHWIVEIILLRGRKQETAWTCLCRKKCQHKLRFKPNSGFTCHTAREQLVFILNEAPLGVFQAALSKNNPVTLHSNWQPSGGQRGVETATPSTTTTSSTNDPTPSTSQTRLLLCQWHGQPDEGGHVWLTQWLYVDDSVS